MDKENISLKELFSQFLSVEKEHGFFDREMHGLAYWEIIRYDAFYHIMIAMRVTDKLPGVKRSLLNYFRILFNNIFYILFRNPFFYRRRKNIFFGTGRRAKREDGLYWDIYLDEIIEKLNADYLLIENMNFEGRHLVPAKTSNIAYSDAIYLAVLLISYLIKLFNPPDKKQLSDLSHEFCQAFKVDKDLTPVFNSKLCYFRAELFVLHWYIWLKKPKNILMINAPNRKALILACRRYGVKTFEFQHGTITPFHVGYSFNKSDQQIGPDYLFTYGEYWKRNIQLPAYPFIIQNFGYPTIEKSFKKYRNRQKKNRFLFVTQPFCTDFLAGFARELSSLHPSQFDIIIKLHPSEYGDYEKIQAKYGTQITIVGPGSDIYELLAESKWAAGVSSTALQEAIKLGCLTYVIQHPTWEYLEDLVDTGIAQLVKQPADIHPVDDLSGYNADSIGNFIFEDGWKDKLNHLRQLLD